MGCSVDSFFLHLSIQPGTSNFTSKAVAPPLTSLIILQQRHRLQRPVYNSRFATAYAHSTPSVPCLVGTLGRRSFLSNRSRRVQDRQAQLELVQAEGRKDQGACQSRVEGSQGSTPSIEAIEFDRHLKPTHSVNMNLLATSMSMTLTISLATYITRKAMKTTSLRLSECSKFRSSKQ